MSTTTMVRRGSAWRRWARRGAYVGVALAGGVAAVDVATDRSLTRSLRALAAFVRIAYRYKTTTPTTVAEYSELHRGAAVTVLDVCLRNEGLYVKLGQGLHAMSHVLPRECTDVLRVLLDRAPPVPLPEVRRIVREDTGRELEELFCEFVAAPVASASIAQVHRARLRRRDGRAGAHVAVKVQKPSIRRQAEWDLYVYVFISRAVQWLFGLPTEWSRKTIVDGLRREMDFALEAANARRLRRRFVGDDDNDDDDASDNDDDDHKTARRHTQRRRRPRVPDVYVPRVYGDYTTPRLLVTEWIDATKLVDVPAIRARYDAAAVLRTVFDAFARMVFVDGFVHCDPHPANVLVRPKPSRNDNDDDDNDDKDAQATTTTTTPSRVLRRGEFQVVFIDFGLCVPETERFRVQYALLFKSAFTRDTATLRRVLAGWGVGEPEAFAAMQLQKPLAAIQAGGYDEVTREEVRAMQRRARERFASFLRDQTRLPRELPLVTRGMDILRGVNRLYGSPVNRVNMFVSTAVAALGPLHDYDAAERYLRTLRARVAAARRGDAAAANAATEDDDGGGEAFASVFDDDAAALRREQAAVLRAMAREQRASAARAVVYAARSAYHRVAFRARLLSFALAHALTRWYDAALSRLLPSRAAERLHIDTLDERLDRASV